MTPAERARMIERQEFEAESKALLRRTRQYVEQRRATERTRVERWIERDAPQMKHRAGPTPAKRYTHNGEAKSLTEWAVIVGVTYRTLARRVRTGMPFEQALMMERGQRAPTHTINGVSKTLEHWAADAGIAYTALTKRMSKGYTLAEALVMPAGRWPKLPHSTDSTTRPGVSSNLEAFEGTGAGSTAQEIPDITFEEKA